MIFNKQEEKRTKKRPKKEKLESLSDILQYEDSEDSDEKRMVSLRYSIGDTYSQPHFDEIL